MSPETRTAATHAARRLSATLLLVASVCWILVQAPVTEAQRATPAGRPAANRGSAPPAPAINRPNKPASGTNSSQANGRLEIVEDELPADFYEMPAEQLDLGMNATGRAPVPILNVAVLQNGQRIDSEVTVHPGTPLEMVIYLDDKSAKVYGLLASYLKVHDTTKQREETIILNGCSIDTYIFSNFELNQEDQSLRAKFRAFKFPDSNFVRFVGTVNVCIKQCATVNCSGERRKRAAPTSHTSKQITSAASNGSKDDRLVSLTVSTLLRIADF